LDTSEPVVGVQTTCVAATTALVCVDMQRDFVEPGTATRSDAAKAANLEDLVDLGALVTTSAALDVDEARVR
jgi:nicotinamidase-related amidase